MFDWYVEYNELASLLTVYGDQMMTNHHQNTAEAATTATTLPSATTDAATATATTTTTVSSTVDNSNARAALKVLHVGCGNSELSAQLFQAGYTQLTNIDISDVLIQVRDTYRIKLTYMH